MATPKKKPASVKKAVSPKKTITKKVTVPVKKTSIKKVEVPVNKIVKKVSTTKPAIKSKKITEHLILDLSPKAKKAKKEASKKELLVNKIIIEESPVVTESIKPIEDLMSKFPHLFIESEKLPDELEESSYFSEHGTKQTMIFEPDSIGFIDNTEIVKKQELEQNIKDILIKERECEIEGDEEAYEDLGDITTNTHYSLTETMAEVTANVDKRMFKAFSIICLILVSFILFYSLTNNNNESKYNSNSPIINITPIIMNHDSDKVIMSQPTIELISSPIDTNTSVLNSKKDTSSNFEMKHKISYLEQRRLDSILIEKNKTAEPIYVSKRRK